ncbi:hypothetical protein ULMS_04400 [Patiriisocius marinistellae]|uniref:Uncharacterized protein n=1 Tax=Patiriisocius marinistellae TaxID=2494560 RepID=A0A5J4FV58_9FLAO|nr:hypothetical protein [Patiriisocius marinistellae]GEQ84932.1 hypothetical protein ULMS_04400 [Patiriisocius marinistellae]
MRPQIVSILTFVLCFLAAVPMLAQGPSASSGPPAPGRGPTLPELPLDTNIVILFIAGLIYGAYVAYKKYRTTNIPQ